MQESTWQRYAVLGGVIFVVLNVIGAVAQGEPPASDGDPGVFVEFFTDHAGGIVAQTWLAGLSMVFLLWFAATLWRQMTDVPDGSRLAMLSMAGLVLGAAMLLTGLAVYAATAHRIDEIGDGSRPLYFLAAAMIGSAGFGIGLHLIAVGLHSLRSGLLSRWLTVFGLLVGAVFIIGGVSGTATDQDVGYLIGFLGFVLWMIWILIVSAQIWREKLGDTA